jgi:hypothetical protein
MGFMLDTLHSLIIYSNRKVIILNLDRIHMLPFLALSCVVTW